MVGNCKSSELVTERPLNMHASNSCASVALTFKYLPVSFLQLLCLIGEAFDDYSDDVCGAVVNIRTKGDKIAVWTTDYENRDAVTHIG